MIDEFSGEYRWLSNFYPCEVVLFGDSYPTVENAYQAAKARTSRRVHPTELEAFKHCSPGEAKRLAKGIKAEHRYKLATMKDLLDQKFRQPYFSDLLLSTEQQHLEEGNQWGDRFWGVCEGIGSNHLGRMIMEIRGQLQRDRTSVESVSIVNHGSRRELKIELSGDRHIAVPISNEVSEIAATSEALKHAAFLLDKMK